MKKITFAFLLCISIFTFAQKQLSGQVLDENNKALPSASITIEDPNTPLVIAFGISDSKGNFSIAFTTNIAKISVKIKAFNKKPITQVVNNETAKLNFTLQSEATEIKEIKLKTKLITKRGDTISYDIGSFSNKADRTVGDVLRKIPGIEVNKDGSVLYQGDPINKFYVNGKDLMEGGYGAINNSLPKDAVAKIEVLENHQPIAMLRDKVVSQNAAINIKLKSAVTLTGRAELGAGASPLLWNAKVTPMLFTKELQWVFNYKANNNGESVENEGNILSFGNRFEGTRRQAQPTNWLSVDYASTPSISEKRYLFNNVHFLSVNVLKNLTKEWELKMNGNYINNVINRESESQTTYNPSSVFPDGLRFSQTTNNRFYTNQAKAEVIFTKNAKKGFFKNTTTLNGFWNSESADAVRQSINSQGQLISRQAKQNTQSPSSAFQNSLSAILPWKEKMINLLSYVNYKKDRQALTVDPSSYLLFTNMNVMGYDKVHQNFEFETFVANHSASVSFTSKKWTFSPEIGLDFSKNNLLSTTYGVSTTDLETNYGQDFQNNRNFVESRAYGQLGINFKNTSWNLNLNLPLNFRSIQSDNLMNNNNLSRNKPVFEPSYFVQYEFSSFWKASSFGSVSFDYGGISNIYSGFILLNPSNLSNPSLMNTKGLIPENLSKSIGGRLEYRNPLNNLFFNLRTNYNITNRNLINSSQISSNGQYFSQLLDFKNTPETKRYSVEVGKYIPKFKSNVSSNFGYNTGNSFFQNNSVMVESINDTQSMGVKLNNAYFSWMSLDYNFQYNWNTTKSNVNTAVKSTDWNHTLQAYFYPKDNHSIGFTWDDLTYNLSKEHYRNSFYDLSYQYSLSKSKIDFEIKWLNIANTKVFERVNVTSLGTVRNTTYIRPAQLMLTVKFNFK